MAPWHLMVAAWGCSGELAIEPASLEAETIRWQVDDPVLERTVTYQGVPLEVVARFGEPGDAKDCMLVVHSADGYRSEVPGTAVRSGLGMLALGDQRGRGAWPVDEPVLGPVYLVWKQRRHRGIELPWPYQVVRLSWVSKTRSRSGLRPEPSASASVVRGFDLVQQKCLACHQLGEVGGQLGPNLLHPVPVVHYWNGAYLERFLVAPTRVKPRTQMPAPGVDEEQAADVVAYLRYLSSTSASPP